MMIVVKAENLSFNLIMIIMLFHAIKLKTKKN